MLREAEERLQALVEHSSDLIVVVGDDGTIKYEAGSVEAVLGARPGTLRGRKLSSGLRTAITSNCHIPIVKDNRVPARVVTEARGAHDATAQIAVAAA